MSAGGFDYMDFINRETAKATAVPYSAYSTTTSTGATLTEKNINNAILTMYNNDSFLSDRYGAVPVQTPQDALFRAIEKNIYII